MKKQKKAVRRPNTDRLFRKLRLLSQKKGSIVYNIYIRNGGVGIAYVDSKLTGTPRPESVTVYHYHRSLHSAIVGEIRAWQGKT